MKSKNALNNNNPWDELFKHENEEARIEHETHMLAFRFLGEVQRWQELLGVNRKELAKRVGTSASYITQLYRGDKIPNLEILIKMSEALNIDFRISSRSKDEIAGIKSDKFELLENTKKNRLSSAATTKYNKP